jgi:thiol-disulfide isomerase/thioredoxin
VQNKNWIVGLVILVLIVGLGIWGFSSKKPNAPSESNSNSSEPFDNPATPITTNEPYFDSNAKVMEFYQPNCGWCQKESPILQDLAKQGYRVKPMNVAADQSLWTKYGVTGTPTFVAASGDKLTGYQTEDQLKTFLDTHK